ncbi:2Fe-2S iron-sulfur cluster-binding protein [Pantoea sp. C2G6]|uniref:2Fe-2S iron-sulfur cluster-binding protein n=1 Tax=Pantoea sp. C2G6 TaxID=3243084 RepID=UPI003EDA829B
MKLVCEEASLLTARMKSFRLMPVSDTDIMADNALPGEYFVFNFDNGDNNSLQRCYTLVSAEQGKFYEFIIEDRGAGSASNVISRLLQQRKEVNISGRGGNITFNTIKNKKNVLLIAGGVGITLPMALIRECFKSYGYSAPGVFVQLILSCHDLGSVPCLNELLDLHTQCGWFSMRIHVTRVRLDKSSDFVRAGRIDLSIDEIKGVPESAIVCGGADFAQSMVTAVSTRFPQALIAVEAFSSGRSLDHIVESDTHKKEITLKSMGKVISVDSGLTVLDNLISHNVSIRNMCRSGICGSCKFRLHSGEVRSEPDFCLSAKDKSEKIHLACCSFPSENAVIDII